MYKEKFIDNDLAIKKVAAQEEICWVNPYKLPFNMADAICQLVVSDEDIEDAEKRLLRFAPFIKKCFPETEKIMALSSLRFVKFLQCKISLKKLITAKFRESFF